MDIINRLLSALLIILTLSAPAYSWPRAQGVQRDASGHIHRSSKAKHEFMRRTGYPHGRPGYVVDHIVPLKRGGADVPENMQWQTIEEAKEKNTWE